jgi:hypothetical protein
MNPEIFIDISCFPARGTELMYNVVSSGKDMWLFLKPSEKYRIFETMGCLYLEHRRSNICPDIYQEWPR